MTYRVISETVTLDTQACKLVHTYDDRFTQADIPVETSFSISDVGKAMLCMDARRR